jgi:hypothetical protein
MVEAYPLSMPCRYEGFPGRIRIVCGPAFDALRGCPYSFGSRVTCALTPSSGVAQGDYVPGSALPRCEIVYSDTGDDTAFDMKISFYGHGVFRLAAPTDARYSLAVVKGLRVEAMGLNRSFEITDHWETGIAAVTDLSLPPSLPGMVRVDDDARQSAYSVTWYGGRGRAGYVAINGVLQLGGEAHLRLGGGS